jgi:hypothetical protein
MAGTPTKSPPKMQINRNGDCAPFAPEKMAGAATRARVIKTIPTLVGTGFPVTFTAPILI